MYVTTENPILLAVTEVEYTESNYCNSVNFASHSFSLFPNDINVYVENLFVCEFVE